MKTLPGCGSAWKNPSMKDLMQVGPDQFIGQPLRIGVDQRHRVERRDFRSAHELHRQHAGADVAVDRRRHDDTRELREVLFERSKVTGLGFVVELVHQRAAELEDHRRELVAPADLRVLVDEGGDLVEHGEIGAYLVDDPGALHLDGDWLAVAQRGPMHLAERCRRKRLGIEGEERLRQPHLEVVFYRLLHLRERHRLDIVLKAAQGFEICRRQQVRPRGEHLAQLHERGTELLEVFRQSLCLG